MSRWKYKIVDSKDVPREGTLKGRSRDAVEDHLNDLGAQGWEIIGLTFLEMGGSRLNFVGVAKRERT